MMSAFFGGRFIGDPYTTLVKPFAVDRLLAGELEVRDAVISSTHWQHDVEDNAYALMRTDAGVVAMLHSSATQWRHRFSLEITLSEEVADELIPRVFEIELQLGPAIELGVATNEVRLEQPHAATDVPSDQVRVDHTLSHERSTDRRAFARMQIREADGATDAVLRFCRGAHERGAGIAGIGCSREWEFNAHQSFD